MQMNRFDAKGMIVVPNPVQGRSGTEKMLIVRELFCQAGHALISERALFNGYPGILLGIGLNDVRGLVALSPVWGDKTRVSVDIDLPVDRIVNLFCPTCGIELPRYATCGCGAELTALFLNLNASFNDCIGVCNRVGCMNSRFVTHGELVSETMLEQL